MQRFVIIHCHRCFYSLTSHWGLSGLLKVIIMPTSLAHSAIAVGLGPSFLRAGVKPCFWALGALYAALPDIDTIGYRLGIPYAHFFGHRGFTHSLTFALILASITAAVIAIGKSARFSWPILIFLFLCTASHGILDAMTSGGIGVALFSPFSDQRIFLSWRPIEVSPLSITRFMSLRGARVLRNELLWVISPALVLAVLGSLINLFLRHKKGIPQLSVTPQK